MVLYAAAWAHTTREARARRYLEPADPIQGPQSPRLAQRPVAAPALDAAGAPAAPAALDAPAPPAAPAAPAAPAVGVRRELVPAFAAGAGPALALVALLRRTTEEDR